MTREEDIAALDLHIVDLDAELDSLENELEDREVKIEDQHQVKLAELKEEYERNVLALVAQRDYELSTLHEELEERMRPFQKAHAAARTRHNSLVFLVHPPPEVTGKIFSFIYEEDDEGNPNLIAITHVCQHWRSVALAYPALWTKIRVQDRTSPEWIETLLSRSGDLPLHIDLEINPIHLQSILETHVQPIRSSFLRIKSLNIYAFPPTMTEILLQLDCAAPMLHSLSLRTPTFYGGVFVPRTIFRMDSPNLRRFALIGAPLSLQHTVLMPSITEITLQFTHEGPDIGTLGDLCRSLASLVFIRKLTLKCRKTNYLLPEDLGSQAVYSLSKLESFSLSANINQASTLLYLLRAPVVSLFTMDVTEDRNSDANSLSVLFECITDFLRLDSDGVCIVSAEIHESVSSVEVSAWTSTMLPPFFTLSFSLVIQEAALQNMTYVLGLRDVEAVIIRSDPPLESSALSHNVWRQWLEDWQYLTMLNVTLASMKNFLWSLHAQPYAVPNLKRLLLQNIDLAALASDNSSLSPNSSDALEDRDRGKLVGALLVASLLSRQGMEVPITQLYLRRCSNLTPVLEVMIREVVGELFINSDM